MLIFNYHKTDICI